MTGCTKIFHGGEAKDHSWFVYLVCGREGGMKGWVDGWVGTWMARLMGGQMNETTVLCHIQHFVLYFKSGDTMLMY